MASFVLNASWTKGAAAHPAAETLRFGMVTDAHYADAPSRGSRHYRESLAKMAECVDLMNQQKLDFLIQLGDLTDQRQPLSASETLRDLDAIKTVLRRFNGPRYHVLGNHDMDSLAKDQVLARLGTAPAGHAMPHYTFTSKGVRCIVLDANFTADGADYHRGNFHWADANLPSAQLDWLQQALRSTAEPVLVFVHQLLDGEGDHAVNNAAAVRAVLQSCPNLLAVFQGHQHSGQYRLIDRIHYYTLRGMVEGAGEAANAYAIVELHPDGRMDITGYRRAESRTSASSGLLDN